MSLPLPLSLSACLMRSLLDNCICHATFAVRCTCVCVCVCLCECVCVLHSHSLLHCDSYRHSLSSAIFHSALRVAFISVSAAVAVAIACRVLHFVVVIRRSVCPCQPPSFPSLAAALFHLILVHFNCLLSCAFALRSASFAAASLSLISQGKPARRGRGGWT